MRVGDRVQYTPKACASWEDMQRMLPSGVGGNRHGVIVEEFDWRFVYVLWDGESHARTVQRTALQRELRSA